MFLSPSTLDVAINLAAANYTVVENEGEVEVCVVVSEGSLQRNAIVTFSTTPGSAEGSARNNLERGFWLGLGPYSALNL